MVNVSIIIPTYNGVSRIRKTIDSIKDQNFSNYEIIVVDNSCNEEIKKVYRKY